MEMEKPAVCGGIPVRDTKLFYGHQYIDEADIQAVVDVLKSDYLTCGPKIGELEKKLCQITGAKYAVVCSNGTAALHMACMAAGVEPGDEVITTPVTFAASANCALYCGARPVFADIREDTYNIDPESVAERTGEKTKAVVAVDFTGQSVQLDELLEVCREKGLVLIEDGAHVIGTKYKGRPNGSIADMTTFSFHPVKTVTGGEGGAVLTNSEAYYQKLLLYRAHGITRDTDLMEGRPEGGWYYEQLELGYNYRMTDIQAALGCSQMNKLDMFLARRRQLVERYNQAFAGVPNLVVPKQLENTKSGWHLYVVQVLGRDRKEVFAALQKVGIGVNVHYIPLYHHPYYKNHGYQGIFCPNAESLYQHMISLPLYPGMTDEMQDIVVENLLKI